MDDDWDIPAMDRILADIDAGMASCDQGYRCCLVRNDEMDATATSTPEIQ